jgi:hypothetical protein
MPLEHSTTPCLLRCFFPIYFSCFFFFFFSLPSFITVWCKTAAAVALFLVSNYSPRFFLSDLLSPYRTEKLLFIVFSFLSPAFLFSTSSLQMVWCKFWYASGSLRMLTCLYAVELLFLLSPGDSAHVSLVDFVSSHALLKLSKTKNKVGNDWDSLQYSSPSCVTTSLLLYWTGFHSLQLVSCSILSLSCLFSARLVLSFIRRSLWPPNL